LLETLWDLVRHGELDAAIRVCEQGGEPWRGASLMGGRRWTMGGLSELHQIAYRLAASCMFLRPDC
jgi:nuclear pore complex protein Nup107